MKRSNPEPVSKLLKELLQDNALLKLAREHEELSALWDTLPDPTFGRMSVEIQLSTEGLLIVRCPSPMVLNYVRLKRPLLEEHLAPFMQKYGITTLDILLKE